MHDHATQKRGGRNAAMVVAYALMLRAEGDRDASKSDRLPWYAGEPGTWNEGARRAYAWNSSTTLPVDKRGARLLGCLKGAAWDAVEHIHCTRGRR